MKEIDLYLQYLHEGIGDAVARGVAKGLGTVQKVAGYGMMGANLLNMGNLSPVAQGMTALGAGSLGLGAYQRWKAKRAAQQQQPQQGQPQQQMKFPNR